MELSDSVLQEGGYRLTPQRYLILRVIREAGEHLSFAQICQRVQELNPCVNQSTVYRTLDLLLVLGLVRTSHLPGKQTSYEIMEGHAHHHFVCLLCQSVVHLNSNLLLSLPEQLREQYHIYNPGLELTVTGYCETCWQKVKAGE